MRFSFAIAQREKVRKRVAAIDEAAWTAIKHTDAVLDADEQRCVSGAEVTETAYTAFAD
ncbi:hypothetical protein HHL19_07825 [Streptomyces sp. R302]|uniref:hypothetical protein n=1 Tax=unclassified Streptomyces TaxID=2593676 RepID=UPI00145FB2A9|nr:MULTISPECIES: hypothetical protein [unclassified Streptomyces]NML54398.1 hypothetical protein [Streptomyces sp. R301]NML78573.1 hypothetical protein [Streptomyces sp. R302]